jgi:hypothetical protein
MVPRDELHLTPKAIRDMEQLRNKIYDICLAAGSATISKDRQLLSKTAWSIWMVLTLVERMKGRSSFDARDLAIKPGEDGEPTGGSPFSHLCRHTK